MAKRKTYRKKRVYKRKRRLYKKKYNNKKGYRLQMIRVSRAIDYLVPSGDKNRGVYGCYNYLTVGTGSTTANTYASAAYDFRITDVYNVTEFGALFDQYKIKKVKLVFKYITSNTSIQYPSESVAIGPQNSIVTFGVVNDYDDSTAYGTTNADWSKMQETGRAKYVTFPNNKGNKMSITCYPKLLVAVYDTTGAIIAGKVEPSGWMDGSPATDVLYRGVKAMIQCPPGDTEMQPIIHTIKCTAYYYLQFRQRQ